MLTDQEEDKKSNPLNPLKKAMRRRNVKTVQFAPPSYVEPSDNGQTTDEEEEGHDEDIVQEEDVVERQNHEILSSNAENGVAEAAKPNQQLNGIHHDQAPSHETRNGVQDINNTSERARDSEEAIERSGK